MGRAAEVPAWLTRPALCEEDLCLSETRRESATWWCEGRARPRCSILSASHADWLSLRWAGRAGKVGQRPRDVPYVRPLGEVPSCGPLILGGKFADSRLDVRLQALGPLVLWDGTQHLLQAFELLARLPCQPIGLRARLYSGERFAGMVRYLPTRWGPPALRREPVIPT